MTFVLWLIVGGILGWLASIIMKRNDQMGIIMNIVVGIVGAFLGGLLLAPLFGTGTINQSDFSIGSLLVSFLGAIILLALVNLIFRRRRTSVLAARALAPAAPGVRWGQSPESPFFFLRLTRPGKPFLLRRGVD